MCERIHNFQNNYYLVNANLNFQSMQVCVTRGKGQTAFVDSISYISKNQSIIQVTTFVLSHQAASSPVVTCRRISWTQIKQLFKAH